VNEPEKIQRPLRYFKKVIFDAEPELREKLRAAALKTGWSQAQIIRQGLHKELKWINKQKDLT
jgi:hypothetical protein